MPQLGLILTHAPDLVWLAQRLRAANADVLKVVTGWGIDGGWTKERIAVATHLAPALIVRTVAGDPSAPGAPVMVPDLVVREVTPWYQARDRARPFFIELGNEPLLRDQADELAAWEYNYWLGETITACRRAFPEAKIIAPAHILNHPIRLHTHVWGQRRFMEICAEAVARCDAVALHCYTPDQVARGLAWCNELHAGMPVWVTEAGINQAMNDSDRGRALAAQWRDSSVAGVVFYHLVHAPGADPLHFNPHYSLQPAALEALGAAWRAAPTPATGETVRLGAADDPPIWDIDLSAELAALPKRQGAQALAPRTVPDGGIIVHYGGRPQVTPRTRAHELNVLRSYARHHLERNWGSPDRSIYANTIMYRWSVLSDGAIVRLVRDPLKFWHSGNTLVNDTYEPVVLPLGDGQPLMPAQAASLTRLLDRLRGERLARTRVFGHCEVPRTSGAPVAFDRYQLQPQQSECPGVTIHAWLRQYRAGDPWAAWGTQFPLAETQRGWAIPQRWLREDLGEARSPELYRPDGGASVQYFQRGVILWQRQGNHTTVIREES